MAAGAGRERTRDRQTVTIADVGYGLVRTPVEQVMNLQRPADRFGDGAPADRD